MFSIVALTVGVTRFDHMVGIWRLVVIKQDVVPPSDLFKSESQDNFRWSQGHLICHLFHMSGVVDLIVMIVKQIINKSFHWPLLFRLIQTWSSLSRVQSSVGWNCHAVVIFFGLNLKQFWFTRHQRSQIWFGPFHIQHGFYPDRIINQILAWVFPTRQSFGEAIKRA